MYNEVHFCSITFLETKTKLDFLCSTCVKYYSKSYLGTDTIANPESMTTTDGREHFKATETPKDCGVACHILNTGTKKQSP